MMKIEDIVEDIVLLVLTEKEPLKELGVNQNKIFARVLGYDENGLWIENPDFRIPAPTKKDKDAFMSVNASILVAWNIILTIVHFPHLEGFDFPNPFEHTIGFDIQP